MTPPPIVSPDLGARARRRPRSWRWLRLVIPLAVAFAVLVFTGVLHAIETPNVTDPDFLNPESNASIGGRDLADRLRAAGVTIDRVTSSDQALSRMQRGDATLFVPAPGLMDPYKLYGMRDLPFNTQVVLVAPGSSALLSARIPAQSAGIRWTTGTADPGCGLREATAAGRATIVGARYVAEYASEIESCYDGGLVALVNGSVLAMLAGASDPFRNDRIGEYHNAALATGLLNAHHTLVWLDLHHREPASWPKYNPQDNQGDTGGRAGEYTGLSPSALWSAFPGWMWTTLALLLFVCVLLALASGRRLGPPVSEPLPVAVPSAETVAGRGRLYRRAKARGHALDALRGTALRRLRTAFGLPESAGVGEVAVAVAAGTGRRVAEVEAILSGPAPENDEGLLRAVHELDTLMYQAHGGAARRRAPGVPVGRSTIEETR